MAVKSILTKQGARHFGRVRPKAKYPRLSLKNYLSKSLPNPPEVWSWRRLAIPALSQVYLNDSLGDCVIAELAHTLGILTANATGSPILLTDEEIISLYSAIGGYVPGNSSTDNGCDIQTALSYYGTTGLPGAHKIEGYVAIDPTNIDEIRTALFLFENLCFGLELPDSWISPFPSDNGFTWDAAGPPDPNNGHCIVGCAYNSQGVLIDTWGLTGIMTYAAIAKYCASSANGELYTCISKDSLLSLIQKAPNGFDWTQLLADFQAIQS